MYFVHCEQHKNKKMKIFFFLGIFACDAGKFTGLKTIGHLRGHSNLMSHKL